MVKMMTYTDKEIENIIKQNILIDRLELEDISPEDITLDMPLFGDGLGLDSVEALDVIAGLGEEFGIETMNLKPEEMRENLRTVAKMISFVKEHR